ncbi:MAG: hypothetical protein AAB309_01190, partial [Deltaproteobacteria bacterium]
MKKRGIIIIAIISLFVSISKAAPQETQEELTQAHLGETAFLLRKKELLLGLRQTAYGIFDWFSLETIPLYDLFGSWNIFGKLKLVAIDPVSLAARAGIFYLTLEELPEAQPSSM